MSISKNSQNLQLDTKRHSFAHLMAAAVGQMFPEARFGVGPVIENGCYYDFVLPRTLIPEDLPLLEAKIKEMLKQPLVFKVQEMELSEAIALFEKNNQPLKVELLNDLATRGTTSMSEEERADFENVRNSSNNKIYFDSLEAVVLDFGGVVFKQKHNAVIKLLKEKYSLVDKKDYDGGKIWDACREKNSFLDVDFWQNYAVFLGLDISIGSELEKIFFETNDTYPEIVELINTVKKQGKKIYYLTNTKQRIFDERKKTNIFKLFDGGLTDLEVGVSKPKFEIFEKLTGKYNLSPENTLFIDDKLENIESAQSLGFQTLLFNQHLNLNDHINMSEEEKVDFGSETIAVIIKNYTGNLQNLKDAPEFEGYFSNYEILEDGFIKFHVSSNISLLKKHLEEAFIFSFFEAEEDSVYFNIFKKEFLPQFALVNNNDKLTVENVEINIDSWLKNETEIQNKAKFEELRRLTKKEADFTSIKAKNSNISNPKITIYRLENEKTGEDLFVDLCKGPHVLEKEGFREMRSAGFCLDKFSGSYWRGDQDRNIQMQRIYALVYETKEELKVFINQREEAKKRDHRVLNETQKYYTISDLVGSGLPLFQPKLATVRRILEAYLWQINKKRGSVQVITPHIAKKDLYVASGHWDKFGDELLKVKGQYDDFCMKPMNCPHHMQIFKDQQWSYKDLPVRYFEPATVYRDEKPGQLSGLTRVRSITQDDGHLFCRLDQITDEAVSVSQIITEFYETIKMREGYWVSLSVRDPNTPEKYLGTDENWKLAEDALENAAKKDGLNYKRVEGEAAFYGPKLDFMFKDSLAREWQLATIQCDFNLPERFDLEYTDDKGEKQRPIVIHRAISGSLERFLGVYIEHVSGRFPFWLAPTQIKILTVNNQPETMEYVQ
jgi:threonyl-tRNA synthetase